MDSSSSYYDLGSPYYKDVFAILGIPIVICIYVYDVYAIRLVPLLLYLPIQSPSHGTSSCLVSNAPCGESLLLGTLLFP